MGPFRGRNVEIGVQNTNCHNNNEHFDRLSTIDGWKTGRVRIEEDVSNHLFRELPSVHRFEPTQNLL